MNKPEKHDTSTTISAAVFGWLAAVCTALVVIEWFVHRHATYPWEGWPGFYAIFGFVAFAGIVLLGKQLRRVIRRDDDYYND
jgi:O-antigen ligase